MTSDQFSAGAAGYRATMVPSLRPVAQRVVERAALQPGERVLDLGTGTGSAAAVARGEGREVVGVDAAPGMLAIAREEVRDVVFQEMDFSALAFKDAAFDCLLAVHSLLFAVDRRATLAEWRRVTRPGGRLSLSVPGPVEVTSYAVYGEIYARHGIVDPGRYPTPGELAGVAIDAGWTDVETDTDRGHAIVLPDEDAFRVWRSIGSRGAATADWSPEQHAALTEEMLAVTPRDPDGWLRIPFGAIYLIARS
ncbi:MAG TPA: methyltransferase domain-containing protein [Candidatus Limnocylindrales bacterium]|nr:methyltransferase domain-containing protein [Candidatus Limnocylindrales bacterium]